LAASRRTVLRRTAQPGGLSAISRGLSAATPPDWDRFGSDSAPKSPNPDSPGQNTDETPMPSTYLSLHYHIVFGTKYRAPLIHAEWRPRLHDYLGGIVRGLGGFPEGIGGTEDHVHLLVGLRATHVLADMLREVKKNSSAWVHDAVGEKAFAWQDGYAAFTVSASMRDGVRRYIANQEQHHRVKSFDDELAAILGKIG
jgi:putative transposase